MSSTDAPGPPLRRLIPLIRPYIPAVALAGIVVSVEAAIGLAVPRLAGVALDSVIDVGAAAEGAARLNELVLFLFALFALRALLSYFQQFLVGASGARMLRALRDRVYSHLIELDPDFFDNRRLGELVSRLGSDLTQVQSTITDRIPEGVRAVIAFVGTVIILLTMNGRLTALIALMVPPITLVAIWYGRRLRRLSKEVQDSLAEATATAEEALGGIRTVKASTAEAYEAARYRSGLGALLGLELKNARLVALFYALVQFVAYAAFALVLWYGARLILAKELTAGDLTSFLLYAMTVATSVGSLGALYGNLHGLRGSSQRVLEILDTQPSIADAPDARPLPPLDGRAPALALRNVVFRYPGMAGERVALDGIELEVRAGETVGLVGPSGAGKSTLFNLLLRFRDPTSGAVEIAGVDARALALASLRAAFAVVPQEVVIFHGTVADNIRYGRPAAALDEVESAAAAAGAAGFITELSAGYQTQVGERGVKLSAGQRQRIAIARAFLRKPSILLLDEVTSALDPDAEATVQASLGRLMDGRTTLVIAHRLATARNADRIAVLEAGRIVAVGPHEQLMADNALYRRYWQLQSLRDA